MPDDATALEFVDAADGVAAAARARGLVVPAFRSPPRHPTADRTVRRRSDGGFVVAVRVRGRTAAAVAADLVEGVLVANGLVGPEAEAARAWLLAAAQGGTAAA